MLQLVYVKVYSFGFIPILICFGVNWAAFFFSNVGLKMVGYAGDGKTAKVLEGSLLCKVEGS